MGSQFFVFVVFFFTYTIFSMRYLKLSFSASHLNLYFADIVSGGKGNILQKSIQ